MVDPGTGSTIGAIGTILKGIQTVKDLAVGVEVKSRLADLYGVILSAQQSAMEESLKLRSATDRISELEKELADREAWERERKRYALTEIVPGMFAYSLKSSTKGDEPAHWICSRCYEDGFKSLIHNERGNTMRDHAYKCGRCKFSFVSHWNKQPEYVAG